MKRISFLILTCIITILAQAQVTIGSSTPPAKGALLEVKDNDANATTNVTSESGGMVLPRVRLEDKATLQPFIKLTDAEWQTSNRDKTKKLHIGMIVYNLNTTAPFMEGLFCWNGEEWRRMDDSPAVKASISKLLCTNASMSPGNYTTNVALGDEVIVKVPYMGGNGGTYEGTAPIGGTPATNNLFIERIGGKLAYGAGEVMYKVTGTPSVSSPNTTTFPIEFLGQTGNITIGGGLTSLNAKNLVNSIKVNSAYLPGANRDNGTVLPFEEINITETGSYAFSLRLYGEIVGSYTGRIPFYIFLHKIHTDVNGVETKTLVDAAELDVVTVANNHYSYSVTLGGSFEEGDKVTVSMHRINSTAPTWELSKGADATTPVRTSLIFWKL